MISLLIVASVLVDLAALEFAGNHRDLPAAKAFLASLAISQVALVSMWAGLGRTWVFIRLTAVLGVCWLLSRMLGTDEPKIRDAWLLALVFESWLLTIGLMAWRANGLRLLTSAIDAVAAAPLPNNRPQFRIVDFLGATFVLSILLAMLRRISETDPDWPIRPLVLAWFIAAPLAIVATVMAGLALLLTWLVLRRTGPYNRLMALAASLFAGGGLGFLSISSAADPLLGSVEMFVPTTPLLLVGSLIVIRIAGYRLATAPTALRSAAERNASSAMATS